MEKVKAHEYAPGNISKIIHKMLDAMNHRLTDWQLDSNAQLSRPYVRSELLENLGFRKDTNSVESATRILENLLGLGIVERGPIKKVNVGNTTNLFDTYVININKLKSFRQIPISK